MLNVVGLQVPDAGRSHGRGAADGDGEDADHRQFANALAATGGDRLEQGDGLPLGSNAVKFFCTPAALTAAMSWTVS
jgi:hypothetical protein